MAHEVVFHRRGEERVTVLEVEFPADRSWIFAAWSTSSILERWWGPHFVRIDECSFEPKAGGQYRIVMVGEEEQRYPMYGEVREFIKDERMAWQVCLDEHPKSWIDIFRPPGTHLESAPMAWDYEIDFSDSPQGTQVRVTATYPVEEDILTMLAAGASVGWGESFEKLESIALNDS